MKSSIQFCFCICGIVFGFAGFLFCKSRLKTLGVVIAQVVLGTGIDFCFEKFFSLSNSDEEKATNICIYIISAATTMLLCYIITKIKVNIWDKYKENKTIQEQCSRCNKPCITVPNKQKLIINKQVFEKIQDFFIKNLELEQELQQINEGSIDRQEELNQYFKKISRAIILKFFNTSNTQISIFEINDNCQEFHYTWKNKLHSEKLKKINNELQKQILNEGTSIMIDEQRLLIPLRIGEGLKYYSLIYVDNKISADVLKILVCFKIEELLSSQIEKYFMGNISCNEINIAKFSQ